MKNILVKILSKPRAVVFRRLRSKKNYFLFKPRRNLKPLSYKYGFDRGKPVDRFYVEKFMEENKKYVRGNCLEITDDAYIRKYGGSKVEKSDVLDFDTENKKANIYADIRDMKQVKSDKYDCLILTQFFGVIDDFESAISECVRILKPGGAMLVTVSSIGPAWHLEYNFWRFTTASLNYIFSKYKPKHLKVRSYGNVLSGQAFWVGASADELTKAEIEHNDPHFPIISTAVFIK